MTTPAKKTQETDAIIIGGGPVGLALCLDLAMRGIRSVLVERRGPEVSVPKMNMVNGRSMEFVRRWGLADKARAAGAPADVPQDVLFCTSLPGYELARFRYPSYSERGVPNYSPEASWRISQMFFDPLLVEAVAARPEATLLHRHTCLGVNQTPSGVRARIVDNEGEETELAAPYLVACDGAESAIREECGIAMQGDGPLSRNVNLFFTSDDLVGTHNKGHAWANWLVGPKGYWGLVVAVDSRKMWRMSVRLPQGAETICEDEAHDQIKSAIGSAPYTLKAILPWVRRQLIAEQYRDRRILLAGDSCHVMSPTGGLGMNTGLGDAMDLSWKLAAVLQGWAGDALLDSYGSERRAVAIANSLQSSDNFKKLVGIPAEAHVCAEGPEGDAARTRIHAHITGGGYDDEYKQEGSVFGYAYDHSPIVISNGAAVPGCARAYVPSDVPGVRAPHLWLGADISTIDRYWLRPTLVIRGGRQNDLNAANLAADDRDMPIQILDLDGAEGAEVYTRPYTLVRPDGHIAWRGYAPDDWSEIFARAFPE